MRVMKHGSTILFLLLLAAFALTHQFAVMTSLYWYYWWFDIFMHLWGGFLLGFAVHVLMAPSYVPFKPTLKVVLVALALAVSSWEVFERAIGLFDTASYVVDTAEDVLFGFSGGLLAHFILQKLYNRRI